MEEKFRDETKNANDYNQTRIFITTYYNENNTLTLFLTEALNVILEIVLLLGGVDAGQVHPVEPAVLLGLVPVSLELTSV